MSIYRQYEDPWKLEDQLAEAKKQLEEARQRLIEDPDNDGLFEEVANLVNEVCALKERVNFAWQDNEYETEES